MCVCIYVPNNTWNNTYVLYYFCIIHNTSQIPSYYATLATVCVNWLTSQERLVNQLTHSAASPRSSLSVYRRSQWTIGTPLAGRHSTPGGCLASLPSGGDEAIQASSPPDGSSGSTTSGHRRPAMAFLTHLETPQAAGSLLAAAVWSQPSWERSKNSVDQSCTAFRRSKGGYL